MVNHKNVKELTSEKLETRRLQESVEDGKSATPFTSRGVAVTRQDLLRIDDYEMAGLLLMPSRLLPMIFAPIIGRLGPSSREIALGLCLS